MGSKSSNWWWSERFGEMEIDREEGHVTSEAEIRVMQLQAKGCQGNHQKLGKRPGTGFPAVFTSKGEHGPADTLISDF